MLSVSACSSSYSGKADIGSSEVPQPGLPFVAFNVSSNITEDQTTQALLFFSIQESSLIFKNQQDSLVSRVEIQVEILSEEERLIKSDVYQILLGKSPNSRYYEQNVITRKRSYNTPPGQYIVRLFITDLHSGKKIVRERDLFIPDPNGNKAAISEIRFSHKPSETKGFIPINSYNVNMGYDSLRFTFQVVNGSPSVPMDIESKLIRFDADLSPARAMSERNHRSPSLPEKGLDYTSTEIIQSTKRALNTTGGVTIENTFEELPRGNYRFEVSVNQGSAKTLFEVRDFGIKSPNYPQVKSASELAYPLVYIMDKGDYEALIKIQNPDSLKQAIDSFWLRHIKNTPKAREIIRLYYQRVEEANKQFSNFKEGWKTDPGMIYILFGPPLYLDEGFGEMTWFYSFDSGTANPRIYFEDPRYRNNKFPFHNFQLERSSEFFTLQYRQIESWKDGSIIYLSQ